MQDEERGFRLALFLALLSFVLRSFHEVLIMLHHIFRESDYLAKAAFLGEARLAYFSPY
jgi:hypothetical protein